MVDHVPQLCGLLKIPKQSLKPLILQCWDDSKGSIPKVPWILEPYMVDSTKSFPPKFLETAGLPGKSRIDGSAALIAPFTRR